MSHLSREQSPDESGYFTHIPQRDALEDDDYEPSEHDATESENTPERSVTPSPEPSPQTTLGTRPRITARMSVRSPIREIFTIPSRDEAGPSRPRERRVSPPPVARIPLPPAGMTPLEYHWVSGMSRKVQCHQLMVNYHENAIDALQETVTSSNGIVEGITTMMGENNQLIGQIFGELAESRRMIARLRICLVALIGFLMLVVAWLGRFAHRR